MIGLKIIELKDFMNKLLIGEVFDNFLTVSFEIVNFVEITIDGTRKSDWYDGEAPGDRYVSWKEIKEKVAGLVKGDRVPLSMRAVFRLSADNTEKVAGKLGVMDSVAKDYGLFFTLKFEKGELNLITGVSVTDFMIGKQIESLWEEDLLKFLKYYGIAVEEL